MKYIIYENSIHGECLHVTIQHADGVLSVRWRPHRTRSDVYRISRVREHRGGQPTPVLMPSSWIRDLVISWFRDLSTTFCFFSSFVLFLYTVLVFFLILFLCLDPNLLNYVSHDSRVVKAIPNPMLVTIENSSRLWRSTIRSAIVKRYSRSLSYLKSQLLSRRVSRFAASASSHFRSVKLEVRIAQVFL